MRKIVSYTDASHLSPPDASAYFVAKIRVMTVGRILAQNWMSLTLQFVARQQWPEKHFEIVWTVPHWMLLHVIQVSLHVWLEL